MKTSLILLIFTLVENNAHLLLSLSGEPWILENYNKSICVKGNVPGGVYSDLSESKVLQQDLFYRFNDGVYRWVGYDNWTYTTEFILDSSAFDEKDTINLVFEGVDTKADIYLNKNFIGSCSNMFTKYIFPIHKAIPKEGKNELQVRLESPVTWARRQAKDGPHEVPSECWPATYHGECHINQIRKMQASFAWDWGPAFPSMGIWKDVYLEKCWSPMLSDIGTAVQDAGKRYRVEVTAWFDPCGADSEVSGALSARLHLPHRTIHTRTSVVLTKHPGFLQANIALLVDKEDVELWWPNGYGEQVLYDLQVSFSTHNDLQIKFTEMAFRTVELIQQPLPDNTTEKGLGFHFRINGIDIYAKGSNWIPSDILPERSANQTRIRYLLESAALAHFNMLRVWGGGLYESDFFYKECDRLGIMIWQDLMFACNMYPATKEFLSSVSVEITQQIRRLQHHPSIVLWAGNNENEVALAQNWYDTKSQFDLFKSEYIDLYVKTIGPIVTSLDSSRTYLESSPSNGIESVKEGHIASNPQSSLYGDVHYYNYASNMWDPATYPKTRFTSEFGVQALPSIHTLEEVATPADLEINSKWITWRQHQANGFLYLLLQIPYNLPVPKNLKQFVYYSQINQAMSIKTETETYRRMRSVLYDTGEGNNMGALYWQLNDVWQAPSWSSIDYSGRWKMLHYYAVKFFSPVLVTLWLTPYDWITGYIVSDKLETIPSAKLTVSIMSTKSFVPLKSTVATIDVKPNQGMEILSEDISVIKSNCEVSRECFIHVSLKNVYGDQIAPDSFLFLTKVKNMDLSSPNIQVSHCRQTSDKEFSIKLKSDGIALFVWLEVPHAIGYFSDNGFHMIRQTLDVTFTSPTPFEIDNHRFCESIMIHNIKSVL